MFQRAGVLVSEFHEQNDQSNPDFSININSTKVNVEAKLLVESDLEAAFHAYSDPLRQRIFDEVMAQEAIHPPSNNNF